ncbi:hypothetical protein R5R35_013438 [Gryllus longicercus]|uniref:Uncharacterized protein n=1 Tax=Gryllus longicercus TaxID=2509291 RepID=A0AAN9YVI5_9ORTH
MGKQVAVHKYIAVRKGIATREIVCYKESGIRKEERKQLGCSRKVTKETATLSVAESGESPGESIARVCSSCGFNANQKLQRFCKDLNRHFVLNEYEMYVLCTQLKGEMEVALVDTGSQVSLVKLEAIRNRREIEHADEQNKWINRITGNNLKVIGKILLVLEKAPESRRNEFYVANSLPEERDMELGQDGLGSYGISLTSLLIYPL